MIELTAPETIQNGKPIHVHYRADQRIAGRLRLTAGTENLPFTLQREGRDPVQGDSPRIRGREGDLVMSDWPEQPVDTELVVRFEGAKCWVRVVA